MLSAIRSSDSAPIPSALPRRRSQVGLGVPTPRRRPGRDGTAGAERQRPPASESHHQDCAVRAFGLDAAIRTPIVLRRGQALISATHRDLFWFDRNDIRAKPPHQPARPGRRRSPIGDHRQHGSGAIAGAVDTPGSGQPVRPAPTGIHASMRQDPCRRGNVDATTRSASTRPPHLR